MPDADLDRIISELRRRRELLDQMISARHATERERVVRANEQAGEPDTEPAPADQQPERETQV